MINKYGAETYGISAQQKNPDSSIDTHDSLISCKCNGFLQIPEKYKESSDEGGYEQFNSIWTELGNWIVDKEKKDPEWKSKYKNSIKNLLK